MPNHSLLKHFAQKKNKKQNYVTLYSVLASKHSEHLLIGIIIAYCNQIAYII